MKINSSSMSNSKSKITTCASHLIITIVLLRVVQGAKIRSNMRVCTCVNQPSVGIWARVGVGLRCHSRETMSRNPTLIGHVHAVKTIKGMMPIISTNLTATV